MHALIFDSGIGGLSVVAHIKERLPALSMTYVADDEFRPYGNKTATQLNDRLPTLLASLELSCQPDIIVVACNTASTTALGAIRAQVKAPVVGVVPAIKPAASVSQSRVIAVLGTPGTVKGAYVDDLVKEFASDCQVVLKGSTALVEIAERKLKGDKVDIQAVRDELTPIFSHPAGKQVDAVVLSCTHFPLLVPELAQAAPHRVDWIDSGRAIARRVQSILAPLSDQNADTPREDIALLIGPEPGPNRQAAFAKFGFHRVIGLKP